MDILETLCKELQLSHQHMSRLLLTERSLVSKSISGIAGCFSEEQQNINLPCVTLAKTRERRKG